MPRRRVPTRISDPDARLVAGHLMFASAAEALGGVYGTVALERALGFSPAARAIRQAKRRATEVDGVHDPDQIKAKAKASAPTGSCKKWLEGHVPSDQTLALIAEEHPKVAARMREARDSDLVRALSMTKDDLPFVGKRMAALSGDLWGEYLGCMALGHCNPGFASGLAAGLLHRAMEEGGSNVLVAAIASDRQLPPSREGVAARSLDEAFRLALKHGAQEDAELAFSRAAIAEVWARRREGEKPTEGHHTVSQMFASKPRKLQKFAAN